MKISKPAMLSLIILMGCLWSPSNSLIAQKMDSLSYSLGVLVGSNLQSQGFENIDPQALSEGVAAVINKSTPKVDVATANQIVQSYMENKEKSKFGEAVAQSEAYFKENAKKPGIVALPSGLQYEVLKTGSGASPKLTDKVTTHYHGTLLNGEVFDSSVERGEPASFPVNGVIAGWTEALQLMKIGDKWRLYVPSDLAYGSRGAGGKIKPFTPLIFEVELLKIN